MSWRAIVLDLAIIAAGPASFVVEGHKARADQISVEQARLPLGRVRTSSVWTGRHVFVFGGWGEPTGLSDDIFRFDPQANVAIRMNAKLPEPLRGAASVWSGRYAYIFSGRNGHQSYSHKILRYDPQTDSIETLPTELPWGTEQFSAVWYQGVAYLMGNQWMNGGWDSPVTRITMFDPSTNEVSIMKTEIPRVSGPGQAAVTDGRYIYIFNIGRTLEYFDNPIPPYFGGYDSDDNRIDRYDPVTDTIVSMKSKLPHAWGISAAWNGETAMIFGGKQVGTDVSLPFPAETERGGWYDTIYEFNPATDTIKKMDARLPTVREGTTAVWTGERYYVIGGFGIEKVEQHLDTWDPTKWNGDPDDILRHMYFGGLDWLDEIVSYDPVAEAPKGLSAIALPGGKVSLTWMEPSSTSYAGTIHRYTIYRSENGGGYHLLATTSGNATNFTDTSCSLITACAYRVAAVNVAGQGELSNEAVAPGI